MTDSLLRQVADGVPSAVQACIERFGTLVWSVAKRLSPTVVDAEDAVQDVFLEIWRCAGRFDPLRGSEEAFVLTVARRRLLDRLRRRSAQLPTSALEDIAGEGPASPLRGQREQLEIAEDAARARQALSQLRAEQRQVLELAIWGGQTQEQIASTTGMPLGTVKTHARRGLAKIRDVLGVRAPSDARGDV